MWFLGYWEAGERWGDGDGGCLLLVGCGVGGEKGNACGLEISMEILAGREVTGLGVVHFIHSH